MENKKIDLPSDIASSIDKMVENQLTSVIQETEKNIIKSRQYQLISNANLQKNDLINTKSVSDGPRKLENIGKSGIRVLSASLYSTTMNQQELKKTTDAIKDAAVLTAMPALDLVSNTLSKSMRSRYAEQSDLFVVDKYDINKAQSILQKNGVSTNYESFLNKKELEMLNKYLNEDNNGDRIHTYRLTSNKKDMLRLEKELFSALRQENLLQPGGSSFSIHNYNKGRLIQALNRNRLNERQKELVKEFVKVSNANTLAPESHKRVNRLIRKRIRRYVAQSDVGNGIIMMSTLIVRGRTILKSSYRIIANIYISMHLLQKKAMVMMQQNHLEKLKNTLKKTTINKKVEKIRAKQQKPKRKIQKSYNRLREKFERSLLGQTTYLARHPWKAFKNTMAYKKMAATKVGRAVSTVTGTAKNILSVISNAIATVVQSFTPILWGISIFFGVVILSTVVILFVFFFFDFDSQEESIKKAALEQIKECYINEMNSINQLRNSGAYYSITGPEYLDIRNPDIYEDYSSEGLSESTNAAEILSMAVVHFDFDLEAAGEKEVKEYVRKLYNGSHDISLAVTSEKYQTMDNYGKPLVEERKKAHITITTNYFDSIFSCKLVNKSSTLRDGRVIDITDLRPQCWTCTGYDYWLQTGAPMIWAGGTVQRDIADQWHAKGAEFLNGIAVLDGRFLIAVANSIANVGDYIDVYFQDGSVLPCLVADAKNNNDSNMSEFGHITGGALSVVEFEVERQKFLAYGNPGGNWEPFLDAGLGVRLAGNRVDKVINGGNTPPEVLTDQGEVIVKAAESQLGVDYVYGGTTPGKGLDCSGLTQYCYKQAGISIPRTAEEQAAQGIRITDPQPGDICCSHGNGHVGIYIGNGQMIEAMMTGTKICISPVRADFYVRF